jgi:hypothetical protein
LSSVFLRVPDHVLFVALVRFAIIAFDHGCDRCGLLRFY